MTGPEHYAEGQRYLEGAKDLMRASTEHTVADASAAATASAAVAQAHFAAAQVAVAVSGSGFTLMAWREVLNP